MFVLTTHSFSSTKSLFVFFFIFCVLLLFVERSSAQPKTDPAEVKALNTILGRWGKPASSRWNISGEPCSGAATDSTIFDSPDINPFIKCDCSINGNATCHITELKVYSLDVVGNIPEELQVLRYLSNLNLGQNYLTGPFPAFIGNLTSMQYLNVAENALSGTLPAELGNLQNLVSLGMGANNFSGLLPPELGNLSSLQKLYMAGSGLSGELPSTLSKLKNLQTMWASDNNFSGKMPDFISSWTNLNSLRLQGNSFRGPIPSSIGTLTKLNDLRIGDVINGSSLLTFISNLTSLSILILRNTKISDTMPSDFASFTRLQKLDLSFNNITGSVPQSLFNLSSLNYLFLGNNSLSGSLPILKSSSLLNIDLSYNQLSGSFPTWVGEPNLVLNLVANNFVIDNSVSPWGLNCLQRNTPCNRGFPMYSSFAINCGGSKSVTDSNGVGYDIDNTNLSTSSYYVTDPYKWGVSNVGNFDDSSDGNYILTSQSQILNTQDPELFQTARSSQSSLRYYGLGLQNGNYSVKLQFAEIFFPNPPTWTSTGRRFFDIYIQGKLLEKDFDIRKETMGKSFIPVEKLYVAPVTNNFLEIHFFWAGKGFYGPLISAISVSPSDFTPTEPRTTKSKKTGLIVGIVVAVVALGFLAIIGVLIRRRMKRKFSEEDEEEFSEMTIRPDTFSYTELRVATNDFNAANLLGQGGFGPVYKGKFSDGRFVAVKQLSVASHHGKRQFRAEIGTISAVQHRNLVKLYGCCIEGEKRLLVYEYLENKSLDQAIFGKSNLRLDWPTRFEICLGTARGLAYLHEESRIRIVHRDVKASNILLDGDLIPKISDFGLAKLYDDNKTHITTRIAGTFGYLAPEYAMRGHLTEKADVFGFGVVVLEVLSGRPNVDTSLDEEKIYLLEWAWRLHEDRRDLEIVDPKLSSFNEKEATQLIGVALLCTQASPMLRPHMSGVVTMLAGDTEVAEVTTRPGYLTEYHLQVLGSNFTNSEFSKTMSSTSTQDTGILHSTCQPSVHTSISEGR